MLFSEILSDAITTIKENHDAQRQKSDHDFFVQNIKQISTLVVHTKEHLETIEFLQEKIDFKPLDNELLDQLSDCVTTVLQRIENGDLLDSDVKDLQMVIQSLGENSNQLWLRDVADTIRQSNSSLGVLLEITADESEIRALMESLSPYENRMPGCINDVNRCLTSLARSRSVIAHMGLDAEIEQFMQKLSSGAATLADLSESVEKWIYARSLKRRIKLRL